MVNLQDISCQLMKPAKDLASWNFPLSEILEEYYSLLEGHCDVNFGEAALILQNSVNIYVHRVERLLDETACLNEMFIDYEGGNTNENSKHNKKNFNNSINFDDFKLCNLANEVGKNINTKNKFNVEKPVKLLTRRFAQLENIAEDLVHNMTEIIDIHGDVIGKKYHFRCNQYLNMNGLLIDEPTPDDFGIMDIDISATSGYCSNMSTFDSSYNFSNSISICNIVNNNNTETLTNCCLSPVLDNADCSIDIEDFNLTSNTINEKEQLTIVANKTKYQKNSTIDKQLLINHDTNMNNTDNVCNIPNNKNHHSNKRLKEIKHPTNTKETVFSKIWEPISLTRNISIKKKRFDLINTTSSIISKTESRKRKLISQMYKDECIVNFLLKESKMLEETNSVHRSKKEILPQFQSGKTFLLLPYTTMDDLRMRSNSTEDNTFTDDTFLDDSGILANSSSILDCETRPVSPTDSIISRSNSICSQFDSQNSLPNYERLIEDKMKELLENSDVQTELDRKINKWHQSIQSKLVEVEQKPIFRIQNYASQIIKKLNDKNQNASFENIVDGEHSYDVARYFLALLQLANTYNVDIRKNKNIDECIEIVLLDTGKDA
ncbi:condensin-2 complex subunit H2-like [Vespula squamosa]|uniref:Condensin-2 complex subunit H2-like n=1 Tax=Vespula squamosa TaxID=30214 RepID=A0ABD2AJQ4_VESSQ